jgi:hypothetical protein
MQAPYNVEFKNTIANMYKGWFVAPATTRYRFYVACDQACDVQFGSTPMDPSSATMLL